MTDRPAVLGTDPAPADGRACHCLCAARHGERRDACAGFLTEPGLRVHLNSLHATGEGVTICRSCADAWPELSQP